MWPMPTRPRERLSAWLDSADLAQLRAYADRETDGNVSLMLRLLVREALAARTAPTRRKVPRP